MALGIGGCSQASPVAEPVQAPAAQRAEAPQGTDSYAFAFGAGPVAVDLFTDAACPYCRHFDEATRERLAALIADDEITFRLHPVNYVSGKHGDVSGFSTRAMNLLAAIADSGQVDRVPAVYGAILEAQPRDAAGPAPTDFALLEIASAQGVRLSAELRDAVESGRWNEWVQRANDAASSRTLGRTGTPLRYVPTVLVEGRQFEVRDDGTDVARLEAAIRQSD
jgi:protein-disulfide isomerase